MNVGTAITAAMQAQRDRDLARVEGLGPCDKCPRVVTQISGFYNGGGYDEYRRCDVHAISREQARIMSDAYRSRW